MGRVTDSYKNSKNYGLNDIYTISCVPDNITRSAHYIGAFSTYENASKELKVESSKCEGITWLYSIKTVTKESLDTPLELLENLDKPLPKYFPYRNFHNSPKIERFKI